MGLEEFTSQIRDRVGRASGLDATIKFVLDHGVIHVDTKTSPHTVTNEDRTAQCTVKVGADVLAGMLQGTINPTAAYLNGQLEITGDTSVSLKLGRLFSS